MKIGESIIQELIKDKDVISATIVGSYSEKKNIEKIGDLDVVVICKKLTKKIFKRLNNKIKKKKFYKEILVNSTFGPVKLGAKKTFPIHLMIYDKKLHKDHAIKSPFTCYDWQRSKIFRGISLKKIFPVKNLQLNDFFNARRNSNEYLNDIKKDRISVRKYQFKGKKITTKKTFVKIDTRNRGEFVYHIINFLVINLFKFHANKNIKTSKKQFDNFFLKITNKDHNLLKKFKILESKKLKKELIYNQNIISLAVNFVKKYENFLQKMKKEYLTLNFVRHAKTSMNKKNIFLGVKNNPSIIKTKIKKISNSMHDLTITSELKRAQMSTKFFNSKKIIHNKLINEINYGDADGMSFSNFKTKYPKIIKSWNNKIDIKFPKGENTNDVRKRALSFLSILKRFKEGKKILIISHGFFLKVIFCIILGIDTKKAYKISIEHLKVFQFLKKGKFIIPNLNRKDQENIYNQSND